MFTGKKSYNSDIQIWAMRHRYPQFKAVKKDANDIEFIGDLVVRPRFPIYTISIHYRGNLRPVVKILKPDLVENPPHFYKESGSLCL